jgi:hypothetical protein
MGVVRSLEISLAPETLDRLDHPFPVPAAPPPKPVPGENDEAPASRQAP